ncbi:MAG TPA: hypothetical protein VKV40_07520 [Ktedonobacteraceae bacterium]|nr:hypothetical protein [Ktedonobacteraceae bacterium]
MTDNTNERVKRIEITETVEATETPATKISAPDLKTDRDELKEASQQFLRTLVRTGVHLATKPVYMLPTEPRTHFMIAGREFTRGLTLLAHELTDALDKKVNGEKEDGEKESKSPGSISL